jgi:hypothetical protein
MTIRHPTIHTTKGPGRVKTESRDLQALCSVAAVLILAGCADGNGLPFTPEAAPVFGHAGVEYGADSRRIHFEVPIPSSWESYRASDYFTLKSPGATFSFFPSVIDFSSRRPGSVISIYDYFTPPSSGTMALSLWFYDGITRQKRGTGAFWFAGTVSRVAFNIRAYDDFEITCLDRDGAALLKRTVAGQLDERGRLIGTAPVSLKSVDLASPGIARCEWNAGGGMLDDLEFWPETEPALKLTCNDRESHVELSRGSEMTCNASAEPSGTLTDLQWEFVDSAGRVTPGPAGQSWGGRLVVGGQIRVRALLNGDSISAAATIEIRPRVWPTLRLAVSEENPNHLPAPGAVTTSEALGDAHIDPLTSYPGARIHDGPNAGWWYIDRPLPDIPLVVHINYPAFQAGSAWYNLQKPGIWTNPVTGTQHPHCRRSDVPTLLTLTRQHEGSLASSGGRVSHVDAIGSYLATNAPQDFFEALLATDAETATQTFDEQVRSYYRWKIIGDLTGTTQHKPAGQTDVPQFPCMPRYF